MSKILKSRLRRLFLTSRLKRNMLIKIEDYIVTMLCEDIDSQDIIEKHLELIRLQNSFPRITEFTEFLLMKENYNADTVEVICYEPICCFKKFSYKLHLIKEKFFETEAFEMKCQWLNSLSKMFCYWILQSSEPIPCDGSCTEICASSSDGPSDSSVYHTASDVISKLAADISFICDWLIMEDCGPFILHQILAHFEMAAIARKLNGNVIPCFPSDSVFKLSLFSLTPLILDNLGRLMLRIKAFHDLNLEKEEILIFQSSCNDIKKVFLGGLCENEDTYSAETRAAKRICKRSFNLENSFMLRNHPTLLMMMIEFDRNGLDENFLIDPHNRLNFFNHLARQGLNNFTKLMTLLHK